MFIYGACLYQSKDTSIVSARIVGRSHYVANCLGIGWKDDVVHAQFSVFCFSETLSIIVELVRHTFDEGTAKHCLACCSDPQSCEL